MALQTMPDNILLGILEHDSWDTDKPIDFKEHLYLLGIFQRLRAIALPIIYSHVYITSGVYESHRFQRYVNKYSKRFPEDTYTNADIITLANCTHMVKSATIDIYAVSKDLSELNNVIVVSQTCSNSWPSITKLEINLMYDNDSVELGETHSIQRGRKSKQFSQELANIMPVISNITFLNQCNNLDINKFYNHVVGTYANQLVKLVCEYGFDYTGSQKFEAIQHLLISMSDNNMKLPRINYHTLVYLHIDSLPVNVSWAPFMDSKNDPVIEFSCLKTLRLYFNSSKTTEQTNVNKPELSLKFPKLKSLTIYGDEVCSFFEMAKLPNEMDFINIYASPALIAQLKDTGLPIAKKVVLRS